MPATLFDYWDHQAFRYVVHQRELTALADAKAGRPWDNEHLTNVLEVWNYSRIHRNSRLTPGQYARIRAVPNVWVRAAYWQHFPELCSPDWVLCLFADLKRTVLPLDDKAVQAVCRGLADDRYTTPASGQLPTR